MPIVTNGTGSPENEQAFSPSRREQTFELAAFLFLIGPSLVLSFFAIKVGTVSFVFTAVATILRDLAFVFLIIFFIWHNREPLSALGLRVKNPVQEIVLGVLLFIPFYYAVGFLDAFLQTIGLHASKTALPALTVGKGIGEYILATLLVTVVAFSEETIFRGYLMLRFRGVTASTAWAVLLSSIFFSLGHGYEGSAGVVTVGAIGVIFALVYLWRGNLVAAITMHFLQDFISIVLVSVLGAK